MCMVENYSSSLLIAAYSWWLPGQFFITDAVIWNSYEQFNKTIPNTPLAHNRTNVKDTRRSPPTVNKYNTALTALSVMTTTNMQPFDGYTCLYVKAATFFHLNNKVLAEHLVNDIIATPAKTTT